MDEKEEKSQQIVKSLKVLKGVLKTSPDAKQRARVKKEIGKMRKMLQEMYPEADIRELEEAIHADSMTTQSEKDESVTEYKILKDVEIEKISPFKDDVEVNEAAGILKYLAERIWGVVSDQHTKLDFSNSGERDALFRKLDQCERSFKMFFMTLEDIEKASTSEYKNQLQMMRVKQGRLFLFGFYEFIIAAKDFVTNLVSDSEFGGTMVLNSDEKVEYSELDEYKTFDGMQLIDALKFMKDFLFEAADVIKVPDMKKFN